MFINEECNDAVIDLLQKRFKTPTNADELPWEQIKECEVSDSDRLKSRRVYTLLRALPIQLYECDVKRTEQFVSLREYYRSLQYPEFGFDWPAELGDSMGLDSLLDWDFDIDATDEKKSKSSFNKTQTLLVTERTVCVMGSEDVLELSGKVLDAIVIPNQNGSDKNDVCLLCLASGELCSLDFMYSSDLQRYSIQVACLWNLNSLPANFQARFSYCEENDTVGMVTSMHSLCVINFHKSEKAFFKIHTNVLLQLGCDMNTVTWQAGQLLYIDYFTKNKARVIAQDVSKNDVRDHDFIMDGIDPDSRLFLLDRDNILDINPSSMTTYLRSRGGDSVNLGFFDVTLLKEISSMHYNNLRLTHEAVKKAHFLVIKNTVIALCVITEFNKVLTSILTRLPIPIDDIELKKSDQGKELLILVSSAAEIREYDIDLNDVDVNEILDEPIDSSTTLLLENIKNDKFLTEGYSKVEQVLQFKDILLLGSQRKTYEIPKTIENRQTTSFEEQTVLTEFEMFQQVQVIDLKSDWTSTDYFGSIEVQRNEPVEQYLLIGTSFICSPECYYLRISENGQCDLTLVNDLLPEGEEEQFIGFCLLDGRFLSFTKNHVYVNDLNDIEKISLPFPIQNFIPVHSTEVSSLIIWNVEQVCLFKYDTAESLSISFPKEQVEDVIKVESEWFIKSQKGLYLLDLTSAVAAEKKLDFEGEASEPTHSDRIIDRIILSDFTSVISLADGKIHILSSGGDNVTGNTAPGIVNVGMPMEMTQFSWPWVILNSIGGDIKLLNVSTQQLYNVFDSASVILQLTPVRSSPGRLFALYNDGLSIIELSFNKVNSKPVLGGTATSASKINDVPLQWQRFRWPLELNPETRLVFSSDARQVLQYHIEGCSLLHQWKTQLPSSLEGQVAACGVLNDAADHICIFMTGETQIWCHIWHVKCQEDTAGGEPQCKFKHVTSQPVAKAANHDAEQLRVQSLTPGHGEPSQFFVIKAQNDAGSDDQCLKVMRVHQLDDEWAVDEHASVDVQECSQSQDVLWTRDYALRVTHPSHNHGTKLAYSFVPTSGTPYLCY